MKTLFLLSALFFGSTAYGQSSYTNPVIGLSVPDPSVVESDDGTFFLFATEDTRNVPIYRSRDFVNWSFCGTAFTDDSRPQWLPKGGIWAPDINLVSGKYVMYYSKSVWGGEWDAGIGVAVSDSPTGPFTDHGALFISRDINIQNCIDPFYIEEGGRKYLFWGSFRGIYGVRLADDGMSLYPGEKPRRIAGTFMEGTYIHKRGKYYYLFGSAGTCCEGAKSTYRVTVGRSRKLFGPYVDKRGRKLLNNHYEVILSRNRVAVGPGHNSEIVTDDEGHDYILYHGFKSTDPDAGRMLWLDRVNWHNGWPVINDGHPSSSAPSPVFTK